MLALELKPGFGLFANTVVTRRNVEKLPDTVGMLGELGARLIVCSNTTPEGSAWDGTKTLPFRSRCSHGSRRTCPHVRGTIIRFFGVPMCLLGEHEMLSNDLHWDPRVTVSGSPARKVAFTGIIRGPQTVAGSTWKPAGPARGETCAWGSTMPMSNWSTQARPQRPGGD